MFACIQLSRIMKKFKLAQLGHYQWFLGNIQKSGEKSEFFTWRFSLWALCLPSFALLTRRKLASATTSLSHFTPCSEFLEVQDMHLRKVHM